MTATEELRRLLDERGVEWEEGKPYGANAVTRFKVNGVWLRYVDYGDYQWLDYHEDEPLTPEQAIVATLGNADLAAENAKLREEVIDLRKSLQTCENENAKLRELALDMYLYHKDGFVLSDEIVDEFARQLSELGIEVE